METRTCARNHVPGGGAILVELGYSGQPRGSSNFHVIFDAIGSMLTTVQGREEDVERGMRRAYEPLPSLPFIAYLILWCEQIVCKQLFNFP
jgi:hypothetical protein